MNTLFYVGSRASVAAMFLIMSGTAAISQQGQGISPQTRKHSHGMMDMSGMMKEPHHALVQAYKHNLVNFAEALRHHAAEAKTINAEFARSAVSEMKRSFDQMQQHHQDHMKTMDDKMKAQMADKMKQMDDHHAAILEDLAALDKEVRNSTPEAKSISLHVAAILKHCNGMAKMHGEAMNHKMAGPNDQK